jgi:maltooligosyltrehalose trehalohydrolase
VAVILDVVYNHLGPEGNYFSDFGPYFTDKYKTPWGSAINYDDVYSDGVRRFFIDNAIHWFREYHIDALRLDAIHAIYDFSAKPFLQELSEQVEEFNSKTGQRRYLIAETDQNDAKVIRPSKEGGYGLHAQWCDDFHHALHSLLTGEKTGYYMDFGGLDHLVRSLRDGYAYSGQYSAYRKRRHGNSSHERPADQFIVFSQNHDHVGNRLKGERLSHLLSLEGQKVVAGLVLLSPYIPLLFMGEEYGEEAPFLYFVHHSDPGLIAAVRKGRREEFRAFGWQQDPPDPQSDQTFLRSKLNWNKRNEGNHGTLFEFYKKLIQMRREIPALSNLDKHSMEVSYSEHDQLILLRRWMDHSQIFCLYNLDQKDHQAAHLLPPGDWTKILDSSDESWKGPGSRLPAIIRGSSFAVYQLKGA